MDELVFFRCGQEITSFELKQDVEVKAVGVSPSSHCALPKSLDKDLQDFHVLVRWLPKGYEICAVGTCKVDGKEIPSDTWLPLEHEKHCYLSSSSSVCIRKAKNIGANASNKTQLFVDSHSSDDIFLNDVGEESFIDDDITDINEIPGFSSLDGEEDVEEEDVKEEDLEDEIKVKKDAKTAPLKITKGTLIGERYQIIKRIGSGSMGVVYIATDTQLQRSVALKLLLDQDSDETATKRFIREAQSVGKLRHKNIVAVHDVGEHQGYPFFTMDFLKGKDLQQLAQDKKIPPRKAMQWIGDIATAADYAHSNGIIHRDIKPSNIMITKQGPLLMDFGVAKDTSARTQLTTAGESLGTPAYMPPEQAEGKLEDIDKTSDVYSLGAVLYELLTAKPPFSGTPVEVLQKVTTIDPPGIHRSNPNVHKEAVVITSMAMAKEKKYRYQTAKEMSEDIERYLEGSPIQGKEPPLHAKLGRLIRQNKAVSVLAAAIVFVLIGILGWLVHQNHQKALLKEKELLSLIEKANKIELDEKTPLEEFFKVSEMYTKILLLSPTNTEAKEGKFRLHMLMGERGLKGENFSFAKTMFFLAKQQADSVKNDQSSSDAQSGLKSVEGKEKEKRQEQIKAAKDIIDELKEPGTKEEDIKNVAFSILKFHALLKDIRKTYRNEKNENIEKALNLASKCLAANADLSELTSLEKEMVKLLPYNSPILKQILMKNVQSGSFRVRALSSRLMGLMRHQEALPLLLDRTKLENKSIVINSALQSLLDLKGGKTAVLKNFRQGGISITQFKNAGQWALPLLIEILKQYNTKYQTELIEIFKKIGKSSVTALLKELNNFSKNKVLILNILAELKDQRAFRDIKKNIDNSDDSVRLVALKALVALANSQNKQQLISILEKNISDSNQKIQNFSIEKLGFLQAISAIPKIMEIYRSYPHIETLAFNAISNMGKKSIPEVISYFKESDFDKGKILSIKLLGSLQATQAMDMLAPYLSSDSYEYRKATMEAFGQMGETVSKVLQNTFKKTKNLKLKKVILQILGDMGSRKNLDKSGVNLLIRSMSDKILQDQAIESLAKLKQVPMKPMLKVVLTHPKESTAKVAAAAFGKIGNQAVPYLLREFKKRNFRGKRRIGWALIAIGPTITPKITPLLKSRDPNTRLKATEILAELRDPQTAPQLLDVLADDNQLIREMARKALEGFGDTLVPLLIKEIPKRSPSKQVELYKILGETEDKRAIPMFLALLGSKKVMRTASKFLGKMAAHDKALINKIVLLLEDPKLSSAVTLTCRYAGKAALHTLHVAYLDARNSYKLRRQIPKILFSYKTPKNIDFLINSLIAEPDPRLQAEVRKTLIRMRKIVLPRLYDACKKYPHYFHGYGVGEILKGNGRSAARWVKKFLKLNPPAGAATEAIIPSLGKNVHNTLISMLRDRDPNMRVVAARLLGTMKVRRALPALVRASRDPNVVVNSQAKGSIHVIKQYYGIK